MGLLMAQVANIGQVAIYYRDPDLLCIVIAQVAITGSEGIFH